MLKCLNDIAQSLMAIWVRVPRPNLVGHGRYDQESGAFEEDGFLSASFLEEAVEVVLHDFEVRDQGVHDFACQQCHECSVSEQARRGSWLIGSARGEK